VSYADPAVLSVCFMHGGETFNVIPDTCRFGGTIRDLSPPVFETIKKRLTTIGTSIACGLACTRTWC
jgi:metal-dependent amidase/aminoacylase/carboxypeptidase family protein